MVEVMKNGQRSTIEGYFETVHEAESLKLQLGRFDENLNIADARFLVDIVQSLNSSGSDSFRPMVVGLESEGLRHGALINDLGIIDGLEIEKKDNRGKLSRCFHVGAIPLFVRSRSKESAVEAVRTCWDYGRVIVRVSEPSEDLTFETQWLGRDNDPPAELCTNGDFFLVSFYHGEFVSIYGRMLERAQVYDQILEIVSRHDYALSLVDAPL